MTIQPPAVTAALARFAALDLARLPTQPVIAGVDGSADWSYRIESWRDRITRSA